LRKEGAVLTSQTHCHHNFFLVVPENEDKFEYKLNISFKNYTDVMKNKVFSGKYACAPVMKLRHPTQSIMLV